MIDTVHPSGRLLIIDDEDGNIRLLERILRRAGYTTLEHTTDPRDAIRLFLEFTPDLIVLDLQMPAGDGPTTLTKLKASAKTSLIPVLVVTASKDPKARDHVRTLGASAYLEKPVSADTFIDAVEAFGRSG
jgi:CheY-like chemotaxis protein